MNGIVSVVVPVHNAEKYLQRCIDSLLAQTYPHLELIFVDDGSADSSATILEHNRRRHSAVTTVSKANGGQASARNAGIALATGEYLTFVDADDTLPTTAIANLVTALIEQNADVVAGSFSRVYYDTRQNLLQRTYKFKREYAHVGAARTVFEAPDLLVDVIPAAWAKLFRRALFDRELRFIEGYWYEDLHFYCTNVFKLGKIGAIDTCVYNYSIRPGSIMTSSSDKSFDLLTIFDKIHAAYRESGLLDRFRSEYEFLLVQHVMIGMAYRIATDRDPGKLARLRRIAAFCREIAPNYHRTKYLAAEPLWIKLYLAVARHLR